MTRSTADRALRRRVALWEDDAGFTMRVMLSALLGRVCGMATTLRDGPPAREPQWHDAQSSFGEIAVDDACWCIQTP